MRTVTRKETSKYLTILLYGAPGSGKTFFTAGFPLPVIYAAVQEKGYQTIQHMSDNHFYKKEFPRIEVIENALDFEGIAAHAKKMVASGRRTIVLDGFTFMIDAFIAYLEDNGVKGYDLWGAVLKKCSAMMETLHKLNAHVIWVCSEDSDGRPALQGQFSIRLAHACSMLLYCREDSKTGFEVRTRRYKNFNARTRFRDQLPDPLGVWEDDPNDPECLIAKPQPDYKALAQCLSLGTK